MKQLFATGGPATLITPANDFAIVFLDGQLQGTLRSGNPGTIRINSQVGTSKLSVLTQTIGLKNYGPHYEQMTCGVAGGKVVISDAHGTREITNNGWKHQVGLKGQSLQLWTKEGENRVSWSTNVQAGLGQPLTWWKATFDTPEGQHPLAFDFKGLSKGFAYVNGNGIGRYWNITASGGCPACNSAHDCDYRGEYNPERCRCDCGLPTQQFYHVPRDWLNPRGQNTLVIIDELGAPDVGTVRLVRRR